MAICFSCKSELNLSVGDKVYRSDTCDSCGADMHVCKNCDFYEPGRQNDCKESQAERVLEKERANYCDHFRIYQGKDRDNALEKNPLTDLEKLFSK